VPDDSDMLDWIPQQVPWKNWHETVKANIKGVYNLWYPSDQPQYGAETINRCTAQIQRALGQAKAAGMAARGVGHGWSLSEAPATTGAMIDIARLHAMKPLRPDQLDPSYHGSTDPSALWLVQGGAYISEINRIIEADGFGRSMITSGAANGQTIVGATATGTHGSVLSAGALHDQIVAIHLLAGPTQQYWLERASFPVLKPNLATALGATFLRDDRAFNAVVLGLGAFGVIANVVLRTRPRMLLLARNMDVDIAGQPFVLDAPMRNVIKTLNFSAHPSLKNPTGLGDPYFFQPIIDPTSNPPRVIVMLMYEKPWQAGYVPDYRLPASKFGPGYDFLAVVGRLLDVYKPGVALFAQIARAELFTAGDKTGSWGELFGFKTARTKVASGSVAVPQARILDALDALLQLNTQIGPVPLVFGIRYVRKSEALLAMNRWDRTAVISLDGVHNKAALDFLAAIPAAMDARTIPFTQHWGKTNGYDTARVQAMFGADYNAWIAARHQLLPDPTNRALFNNAYMHVRGLDA
jgi:hypothetical protein